jgi:hypothetical protein
MIKILEELLVRLEPNKLLSNVEVSEGLKFHLENKIPVSENVYRPGSKKYFELINEIRHLYNNDSIKLNRYDKELIETDLGKTAILEEKTVFLDFPYVIEEKDFEENESILFEDISSCCEDCLITEKKKSKRKKKSKSKKNDKKPLNKPMRDSSGSSKFKVYVKDPKTGNIKTVRFGAKGMSTGLNNPKRVKSFVARHRCKTHAKDKTKAAYWSCRLPRYFGNSGKKWW